MCRSSWRAALTRRWARLAWLIVLVLSTGAAGATTNLAYPSFAAGVVSPQPVHRQLWVWQIGNPAELLHVAAANQVTQLLVWVSPGFSSGAARVDQLRKLVRAANVKKMSVVALGGDPSWAVTPATAGTWAQEVARSGLFKGLHLDIEPNALPDFTKRQQALGRGLLAALTAAGSHGLAVSADIPSWFNRVLVDGHRLDAQVMSRVSSVTIMAYSNTAAGVLKAAKPEVSEAALSAITAYIGVNIGPAGADAPSTTMLGLPAVAVFSGLAAITKAAKQWRGYAGLAIHDSVYLAKLTKS